jgi:hypothetical protein
MNTHPLVGFLLVCFAVILLFFSAAVDRGPAATPPGTERDSGEHAAPPARQPPRENPKSK